MTLRSRCTALLAVAALAFAATALPAAAQESGAGTAAPTEAPKPEHGPGASGQGDGSGMGQDTSEIGTPKGPGDKGGPPADKTVAPKICDSGQQPTNGACPE